MAASADASRKLSLPPKKGSEIYRAQENFRGDWRLYNAIIDLLSGEGFVFRNGAENTAGCQLVATLSDALYQLLPEERLSHLKDRSVHLPELFQRLAGPVHNDPAKHNHGRLPPLSRKIVEEMVEKILMARALPAIQSPS